MEIFAERELRKHLEGLRQRLSAEVEAENRNRLLNLNETEYVTYLVEKYSVEPLELYFDKVTATDCERTLSMRGHGNITRQVVTWHVPYSGSSELFGCRPSSYFVRTVKATVNAQDVSFDVVNWSDDAEAVKREADSNMDAMRQTGENSHREVDQYNGGLEDYARRAVQNRKARLLKQADLLHSLGVPVRKAESVPETFAVPVLRKRVVVKPQAPSTAYQPEPALDESIYQEILRITHELGVAAERQPSLYADKDEEALRDLFLMMLAPNFDSATGETFNKSGKTDILIRHEKANVFVAECAFWGGMKAFLEKMDQALGYLTWRDSKAAILCFVKNKELGPVLEQIVERTSEHTCFVKSRGKNADSWFAFEFRLPDDPTRPVHLAVQCFHFPEAPR